MDNLDFSSIAFGAIIVASLNLTIVVLVKTETILIYVDRIKKILKLDYRARAKRADDEIRLLNRYEKIAKERILHTFISVYRWGGQWAWSWDENFEPVEIRGFCTGNRVGEIENVGIENVIEFDCSHPLHASFAKGSEKKSLDMAYIGIYCSQKGSYPHEQNRASFEVPFSERSNDSADDMINELLRETIITERNRLIVREIKKLRLQFWR